MASDSYDYYFINKSELTKAIRGACVETVPDAQLVTSTEATPRVVLKSLETEGKPVSLGAAVVYSKAEIHIELAKPEWSVEAG